MLNWIRRWQYRRQQVYVIFDGQKRRSVDPLLTYRRMLLHSDFRPQEDLKLASGDTPHRLKFAAVGRLATVCRDCFDIMPFADGGLTDADCVALMRHFEDYAAVQKKSIEPTPTSPQPTGAPVCQTFRIHTNDLSDCGSIETESAPTTPTPSDWEFDTHWVVSAKTLSAP